eukprot:tig00020734_g13606.t1
MPLLKYSTTKKKQSNGTASGKDYFAFPSAPIADADPWRDPADRRAVPRLPGPHPPRPGPRPVPPRRPRPAPPRVASSADPPRRGALAALLGGEGGGATCVAQLVRSVGRWTSAARPEQSVHEALLHAVSQARHFIYLENPFFVSSTGSRRYIENGVGAAIADRVSAAIAEGRPFRVYIVLPETPETGANSPANQTILNWQHRSLARGPGSMIGRIRAAHPGVDVAEYFALSSLRTCGLISGRHVSEKIYVHSKILLGPGAGPGDPRLLDPVSPDTWHGLWRATAARNTAWFHETFPGIVVSNGPVFEAAPDREARGGSPAPAPACAHVHGPGRCPGSTLVEYPFDLLEPWALGPAASSFLALKKLDLARVLRPSALPRRLRLLRTGGGEAAAEAAGESAEGRWRRLVARVVLRLSIPFL